MTWLRNYVRWRRRRPYDVSAPDFAMRLDAWRFRRPGRSKP